MAASPDQLSSSVTAGPTMAVNELLVSLASNPYFSAGAGLFGVGSLAAVGRTLGQASVAAFKRHYVTRLEVPCNDKSYHWLLDWVAREAAATSPGLGPPIPPMDWGWLPPPP